MSKEEAFEELTNDCLFGVDMASAEFKEFVKANENLMQKAFRLIRELLEDLQHFMEDWRKELPGMFKMLQKSKWYECMIYLVAGKLKLDCPLLFAKLFTEIRKETAL